MVPQYVLAVMQYQGNKHNRTVTVLLTTALTPVHAHSLRALMYMLNVIHPASINFLLVYTYIDWKVPVYAHIYAAAAALRCSAEATTVKNGHCGSMCRAGSRR